MRILFIHQNFPGQFLHLAPALAARGHEVRALTAATNRRTSRIPTVYYKVDDKRFSPAEFGLATHFAEQAHRGEIVGRAAAQLLANEGYVPDVVFGHAGWGETLYLADIWPKARRIIYAEFFYRTRGLDVGFDKELQKESLRGAMWVRSRQASQLLSLTDAHHALSPTRWQGSTYPDFLRPKISVIHDGINTDLVKPDPQASFTVPGLAAPIRQGDEVLTFVARNLEPYRGFHIFMRALPRLLRERPAAQVVIVGGDGVSYGSAAPDGQSWKQVLMAEVGEKIDPARVHFVGNLPYQQFVALMQATRVHAYLTYPFVLSWSLLEAMSAGAMIVASRTPPLEEVIEDGVNGRLVDFFDVDGWSDALAQALANPARDDALRHAARQTVVDRYDLQRLCLPRQIAFVENGPEPGWSAVGWQGET
jgi:glycosyltransferase involved in cell wall biosynthesis